MAGHIQSFNGRIRDEFLNLNQFASLDDVRARLEAWRDDYNEHRPRGALGHLTPREFARRRRMTLTPALSTAFLSLPDARFHVEQFRRDYNEVRPHRVLGNKTPSEFAREHAAGVASPTPTRLSLRVA